MVRLHMFLVYTDSVLLSRSNNYIGDYIFNDEYEKNKSKTRTTINI